MARKALLILIPFLTLGLTRGAEEPAPTGDLAGAPPFQRFRSEREGSVTALAISPTEARIATGHQNGVVVVWDSKSREQVVRLDKNHRFKIRFLRFVTEEELISGSEDGVGLWSVSEGKLIQSFHHSRTERNQCVAVSPDGSLIAISGHSRITILDKATGRRTREWQHCFVPEKQCPGESVVLFSQDGATLFSAGADHIIREWSLTTGSHRRFPGEGTAVRSFTLSPNGKLLACLGVDSNIHIWEIATRQEVADPITPDVTVSSIGFSRHSSILFGGSFTGVLVAWNVPTRGEIGRIKTDATSVNSLATTHTGRVVAGCSDGGACQWNVQRLKSKVPKAQELKTDLQGLWDDLARNDAPPAYRAIWALRDIPEKSVPFIRSRLRPVLPADPAHVSRLISELDDDSYPVRENASKELRKLGEAAKAALMEALKKNRSAEARRRINDILKHVESVRFEGERLRWARAIAVLELVADKNAVTTLEELAGGCNDSPLTADARAALKRLTR